MTRIAIDAMGGDYAPKAVVEGAVWAAMEYNIPIELVGKLYDIERELDRIDQEGIVVGGGMFAAPPLTKITVSDSIATIEENVFDGIATLADVVIESEAIYTSLTNLNACGDLIEHATKIKVLKSIVDKAENVNAFLNDDANYTRSEDGDYYVYAK